MRLIVNNIGGSKLIAIASGSDGKLTIVVGPQKLDFPVRPLLQSGVFVFPCFSGMR